MKLNPDKSYTPHKSGQRLVNIHSELACRGENCVIHNPSEHALRDWPQHWRSDRRLMERVSPWGCGCPDPDDNSKDKVHGCVINPYTKDRGVCAYWEIDGVEAAWLSQRYAITRDGRVWSFKDYSKAQELRGKRKKNGYVAVNLGRGRQAYVHRLVLTAWRGPCPENFETRHLNGDRADNRLDNLEWSDRKTNDSDKDLHGTRPVGGNHKKSKLTEAPVTEARVLFSLGRTLDDIVQVLDLSINRATLHLALVGKTWKTAGGPIAEIKGRWPAKPQPEPQHDLLKTV